MNLNDVARFDAELFTDKELANLQKFADRCVAASTAAAIEKAGGELDRRRVADRAKLRRLSQRSKSISALYKELIKEVPRRFDKAIV